MLHRSGASVAPQRREAMVPHRPGIEWRFVMTNKTKLTLAVALIAAFATPALAKDQANYGRHQYRQGYVQAPGLYEGRNAGVYFGEPNGGTSSDRESMIHAN